MKTRVVVTGMGVVAPIGIGIAPFWKSALEGRGGIRALRALEEFPPEAFRSRIAGQVVDFESVRFPESPRRHSPIPASAWPRKTRTGWA
jgi:3-oxoacyl-[acyl-carrier-protein] synthase II